MKRPLVVLALLAAFCGANANVAQANDAVEQVMAATFRIAGGNASGTALAVSVPRKESEKPLVVLVTAAHVLDQMKDNEAKLILRSSAADKSIARKETPVSLRDGDKPRWKRHAELDLAAMPIELPENSAIKPLPLEQIADAAAIEAGKVRVSHEVWIPCFPAKLEANAAGWPALRRGTIASHPLAPVKDNRTMLVDYSAFGGDSGAPAVVVTDKGPLVIGVVQGMHRQTDKAVMPLEERTVHTPLGLGIVMQAAYVRETIELLTK